jgi:glycosyltransferase involved in cell wall biosynthesis
VEYCAAGAVSLWSQRVLELLDECHEDPARRAVRIEAGLVRAARFTWPQFAARLADVYRSVADRAGRGVEKATA